MAPEYSSICSLSPAPTLWLISMDAPVTMEKQNDMVVHIGEVTLPSALMYMLFTCPKNILSISI